MSFEEVLRVKNGVVTLARDLVEQPAFDEVNVVFPDPASPEAAFIRITSWLYCLYFEAGRISLTFLRQLGDAYSLVERGITDSHIDGVRCLRTELHHNLGFADSDLETRTAAGLWRYKACGTRQPQSSTQWRDCYLQICADAQTFLVSIDRVVRRIESDGEDARHHIEDWRRRLSRNWTAPMFDRLIDNSKQLLAREALNTVAFRNRHIDRWRRQLEVLEEGFDFESEATRLIERTMLDDDSIVLPVSAMDVIIGLEVKPGPEIGLLLAEARRYFEVHKCSRDTLLEHLRHYRDSD